MTSHEHHHRDSAHEDVHVAIRDAFEAMERQLEDYARKRRGKVKRHAAPDGGHANSLHPKEDCGKIGTRDGRVIYLHRNSVLKDAFDKLEIGSEVRFPEEAGEQGPQASNVTLAGRHHLVDRAPRGQQGFRSAGQR